MADRGIIFTAENARAIWLRQKTQTCRLALKDGRPSVWADTHTGDWLWVREPWRPCVPSADPAGGALYQATRPNDRAEFRSGRHMPKWASRMTLVVEKASIERLQDINEEDAEAEGCSSSGWDPELPEHQRWQFPVNGAAENFARLWDSIHGAGAWAANPEVVRIVFRMRPVNIDSMELASA